MTALGVLLDALVTPSTVAAASRALTAAVGLFVAGLAYRGFQRNDAPKMRLLAVGVGLLTAGAYSVAVAVDWAGAGAGVVLVARGSATVAGLSAVLYALVSG